jgi:hypothetical protein
MSVLIVCRENVIFVVQIEFAENITALSIRFTALLTVPGQWSSFSSPFG